VRRQPRVLQAPATRGQTMLRPSSYCASENDAHELHGGGNSRAIHGIINGKAAWWWNTKRPLANSLDRSEERLVVKATTHARFWSKVDKNGPIPDHRPDLGHCWVWTAAQYTAGYGEFYMGRLVGAHVASWTLARGEVPADRWVLHHCDRRSCVRPSHLFLGTQADNMQDMHAKGRGHVDGAKGEANRHAKLTAEQVLEIRRRFDAGERGNSLAAEFSVLHNAISRIVTGVTWKHLGGPIRSEDHPRRKHWTEKKRDAA
jgi:hypothetical protein